MAGVRVGDRSRITMNTASSASKSDKTAQSRERAERRRTVMRAVRDQRERLTSTSGTRPAFDYELVLTFAQNRISAAYAVPLLIAIVAAAALLWVRPLVVVAWAALVLAMHFAMLVLCRRYIGTAPAEVPIKTWLRRFVIAEFFTGVAWALVLVLVPAHGGNAGGIEIFQFATMLVVISVVTSLASTVPTAAVAGTIPITLTLVAMFLGRGELLSDRAVDHGARRPGVLPDPCLAPLFGDARRCSATAPRRTC